MGFRVRQLRPFVAPVIALSPLGLTDTKTAEAWWGCSDKCSKNIRWEDSNGFHQEQCCSVTCPPAGQTSASCASCECEYNDLDSGDCLKWYTGDYWAGTCTCKCTE